jgi:hypothetical protein
VNFVVDFVGWWYNWCRELVEIQYIKVGWWLDEKEKWCRVVGDVNNGCVCFVGLWGE